MNYFSCIYEHKVICFAFILLLFWGCKKPQPNGLDAFLADIEMNVPKADLDRLKNAPKDSIVWSFRRFDYRVRDLLEDSIKVKKLDTYFDKISQKKHIEYICFALYLKLNHKSPDPTAVYAMIKDEYERVNAFYNNLRYLKQKALELNIKKFHVGDLIHLKFPTYNKNGIKLSSYEILEDTKDFLQLHGRIIQKKFVSYPEHNIVDSMDVYFIIKLTFVSDTNCVFMKSSLKPGMNFYLRLQNYTQVIELIRPKTAF